MKKIYFSLSFSFLLLLLPTVEEYYDKKKLMVLQLLSA